MNRTRGKLHSTPLVVVHSSVPPCFPLSLSLFASVCRWAPIPLSSRTFHLPSKLQFSSATPTQVSEGNISSHLPSPNCPLLCRSVYGRRRASKRLLYLRQQVREFPTYYLSTPSSSSANAGCCSFFLESPLTEWMTWIMFSFIVVLGM